MQLCEQHPGLAFDGPDYMNCPCCWRDQMLVQKDEQMHELIGKDAFDVLAECREKNRHFKMNYEDFMENEASDAQEIARLKRRISELKKEIQEIKEKKK